MNRTERNTQVQIAKGRKLANASFVLAILGLLYAALMLPMGVYFVEMAIGIVLCLVGIVSGIVALVKINELKGKWGECLTAILGIVICGAVGSALWTGFCSRRELDSKLICATNLHKLGNTMRVYSEEHNGKYPTADKWCDLLGQYHQVDDRCFIWRSGGEGRCHYAINPNCEPNSRPDMVLLFETKGGWNQSGGPEILTTENHKPKGCNILFNDRSVKFVKTKNLAKLKWKVEEGNR